MIQVIAPFLIMAMALVYGLPVMAARRKWRRTKHARCLVRIEALERDLFPELHPSRAELLTARQTRWTVDTHDSIQVYCNPYDKRMKSIPGRKGLG